MPVPFSSVLTLGPLTSQSLQKLQIEQPPAAPRAVNPELAVRGMPVCRVGRHCLLIQTPAEAQAPGR